MMPFNLTTTVLTWLSLYGPPALGLVALLGALGAPMPTQLLLLTAGVLAHQGLLNPLWAVSAWVIGCALGEGIYYLSGRYAGGWAHARQDRLLGRAWANAQQRFVRQPGITIFLTRFLITPLGIPTTLIAGSSRYPYYDFLGPAVCGNLMWLAVYGLPGYLLGSGWPIVQ